MSKAESTIYSDTTPLVETLQARISELIRSGGLSIGTRLVERSLAEKLKVSRTPVRAALAALEPTGIVERGDRGYVVAAVPDHTPTSEPESRAEKVYLQIALDWLDGKLDEQVTERGLTQRYGIGKTELTSVLRRIASEGWIEPAPGYGWTLIPLLTSARSYANSYRFRQLVEPAALLEPGYAVDKAALRARRNEQQELVDGRIETVSGPQLFDLNSALHETLYSGSNNEFITDSLNRINTLRRLIEYRKRLQPDRARLRCAEHVELADLVLDDKLTEASVFLTEHLSTVGVEKTQST